MESDIHVRKDELSSTEKLLQQIRGGLSTPDPKTNASEPLLDLPPARTLGRLLTFKKAIQVGVDIGYTDLRLVKTRPLGPQRHQILDYRCVPFEKGLEPASLLFPRFLRNVLSQFCDASPEAIRIWAAVSSAQLDIRYLQIPKVPKRRLANAVYWAYKRKNPFDEKQKLFDFELLGDVPDGDTPRYEVIGYSLPQDTVQNLQGLFTRAGFKLSGVSTYPFLMQQLLRTRWKIIAQGHLCALYVGRTWSRIDIYRDGNLMMSRGIRAGMVSMQAAITGSPQIADQGIIETDASIDFGPAEPLNQEPDAGGESLAVDLMAQLIPGSHPAPDSQVKPYSPETLFDMALPAVDRLVRQVERTIGHYALNYDQSVIDRLCISGQVCANPLITDYIADQLGLAQSHLNPFEGETTLKVPRAPHEQRAYVPALALATAREEHTPNFLMPFHERLKREKHQLLNGALFAVFVILMIALVGFSTWQKHGIRIKQMELQKLQTELNRFVPLVNRETVVVLAAKAREGSQQLAQIGTQYRGLAAVSALTQLTPAVINLIDLKVDMPRTAAGAEKAPRQLLYLSGIVHGNRLDLEPMLAAYMIALKQSLLLANPQITHKAFEMFDNREVLRFTAELELR